MKTYRLFIFLWIIFLTIACVGTQPLTSTTDTQPASTATFEPVSPTETLTLSPTSDAIVECKIPPFAFTNVGLGIPNPTHKLPTVGTAKTIVLFADFNDAPALQTPEQVFSIISPNAE